MEVYTNSFPKLVDVDMITIDWIQKGQQEGIKKMVGDANLTKVIHFVGLQSRPSIVRKAQNMVER